MNRWHIFFELIKSALEILVFSLLLAGIGNLLINPFYGLVLSFTDDNLRYLGELLIQINKYILVYFPLIILIRLIARKTSLSGTIIASLLGYIVYLLVTMLWQKDTLPAIAYQAILGLSYNSASSGIHYPLQTGMVGIIVVALISLFIQKITEHKKEKFLVKETIVTFKIIFLCILAGILTVQIWPFIFKGIQKIIEFISENTSNPVNMGLFGIFDKLGNVLHLSSFLRQAFWYSSNGGSWINLAGSSIFGDAAIWSEQIVNGGHLGLVGHFFTPYYLNNIFIVPTMIWTFYFLNSNHQKRFKSFLFCFLATIASWLSGISLPFDLMLLFLAPILFVFHVFSNGILYVLLQMLHISLGFQTNEANLLTAMPGTLSEFISYFQYVGLRNDLIYLIIIGVIFALLYLLVTICYFKYFAYDLFKTGKKEKLTNNVLAAVGGISNIRSLSSSPRAISFVLNDDSLINEEELYHLGSSKVYLSEDICTAYLGACSIILSKEIKKKMRIIH